MHTVPVFHEEGAVPAILGTYKDILGTYKDIYISHMSLICPYMSLIRTHEEGAVLAAPCDVLGAAQVQVYGVALVLDEARGLEEGAGIVAAELHC